MQIGISKTSFSAKEIANKMNLEIVYDTGKPLAINSSNVSRVGLQLSGYSGFFSNQRVQVMGPSEVNNLAAMKEDDKKKVIEGIFKNIFPCIVFSRNMDIDPLFIEHAQKKNVAIFRSKLSTSDLISDIVEGLKYLQAKTVELHGVLMDIDGVGVLIQGASGIGKSEIGLELMRRGHRLVADDVVVVKQIGNMLEGSANPLVKNFMELRGVGVINVERLYGASSIKITQQIELIVQLEEWDKSKCYDRIGDAKLIETIMDVDLKKMVIPVSPGRNVAVVIETAASVYRLEHIGYHAEEDLAERMKNK